MKGTGTAKDGNVRAELAVFLRAKREQILPSTYGFVSGKKRRTPGLRREEVAGLADMGSTWYTWLEQGREVRPSQRVLGKIASVLRLSDLERQYLFELAGHETERPIVTHDREALASLAGVVDEFRSPAFVRNARYDMLAWNAAFEQTFAIDRDAPPLQRNFLWCLLRSDWGSTVMPDVQLLAHQCVAEFRMAYARRGAPPEYSALVDELHAVSPHFAKWWSSYEVAELREMTLRIVQPQTGEEALMRCTHFDVADGSGLKLVVFSPKSGT